MAEKGGEEKRSSSATSKEEAEESESGAQVRSSVPDAAPHGKGKGFGLMSGLVHKAKAGGTKTLAAGAAGIAILGAGARRGSKALFSTTTLFFLIVLFLHFLNLGNRSGALEPFQFFGTLIIYLTIITFLGKSLFFDEWKTPLLLSFFSFLLPYIDLLYLLPGLGALKPLLVSISGSTLFLGILAMVNPWIIYILFGPIERNWFIGLCTLAYVIVIVILLFQHTRLQQLATEAGVFETAQSVTFHPMWTAIIKGTPQLLKLTRDTFVNAPSNVQKVWKKTIAEATGDYYTGQVEQTKNEPLGVYLENVQPLQGEFLSDEPVIILFTLKARGLDKPLQIKPYCKGKQEGKKDIPGVVPLDGADHLEIATYEQINLECDFSPNTELKTDTTLEVEVAADFSMKTISYLKAYYIDYDKKVTFDKQKVDPLDQYKVSERNPTTQYSNGPIMIGMHAGDPLTAVKQGRLGPAFKVTVDNKWPGKLNKITKLIVYIPEGLTASTERCKDFTKATLVPGSAEYQQSYVAYALKEEKLKSLNTIMPELQNVKSYLTFVCGTDITNIPVLLGATPITTQYFKTTIEYDYTVTQKTSTFVKKSVEAMTDGVISP